MIPLPFVICVGTSAGGVTAVQTLLKGLPKGFSPPLLIVQHLPEAAQIEPELIYGSVYEGRVQEAFDKTPIQNGHAYFAPPGYHLLVERDRTLALSQDEPVHFARPSIDVFFESAALSLGSHACGILMTGANQDGALGLQTIQKNGGWTIVQDPDDAEVRYMPESALKIMEPDFVVKLNDIPARLVELSQRIVE